MTMKLFGFKGTRSSRVEWLLIELGVDYEFVHVDITKGEHKQPTHVDRHGHGLVPAFEDGGVRMIESTATCLYLADKYPEKGLAPALGTPERARYYQLAVYAVSTLDTTAVPLYFHKVRLPPEKRSESVVNEKLPTWETAARLLTRELGEAPYFAGASFGAIDAIVGYDVSLAAAAGLLADHPKLAAYAERVMSRESFKKAHISG